MADGAPADQSAPVATQVNQKAEGNNIIQIVGSGVARIFDIDVNVSVLGGLVIGIPMLIVAAAVGAFVG